MREAAMPEAFSSEPLFAHRATRNSHTMAVEGQAAVQQDADRLILLMDGSKVGTKVKAHVCAASLGDLLL